MNYALRLGLIALSLLLITPLFGCQKEERSSVVLITLDTTRADALGLMGNQEAQTPALDGLAQKATVFDRAFASTPRTLPSHTTMMSGLEPHEHGVRDNGFQVPEDFPTVAEAFAEAGFDTAAFVAAYVLDSDFGLARGFSTYDDEIEWRNRALDATVPQRPGAEVTDAALAWLRQEPEGPFFLWVHYYDAHQPFDETTAAPGLEDKYSAEIAYMDQQVGRLLEGIQATHSADNAPYIVVAADHGESLGEHGEPTHGQLAYDASLHIPMMLAGPGIPSGVHSQRFVQTRDIAATLLQAGGLLPFESSGAVALQDQLPTPSEDGAVAAGPEDDARPARIGVFESLGPQYAYGWSPIAGIRDARWKLTVEPSPAELYDVLSDPNETQNLIEAEPEIARALAAQHDEKVGPLPSAAGAQLEEDVLARLAALGYTAAPVEFKSGMAPDPRKFVGALSLLERARRVAAEGRLADSIRVLEMIATREPVRAVALTNLSAVLMEAGRYGEAVEACAELLQLVDLQEVRVRMAEALMNEGRFEESLTTLDALAEPNKAAALTVRSAALAGLGDEEEAIQLLRGLSAEGPLDDRLSSQLSRLVVNHDPKALGREIERLSAELESPLHEEDTILRRAALADLFMQKGRDQDAVKILEAAENPHEFHLAQRAALAAKYGNPAGAAELYEEALSRRPSSMPWLRELAYIYRDLERHEEAQAAFQFLIDNQAPEAALLVERGAARWRMRDIEGAAADYQAAIALDPALPEAHFNLGLIEGMKGRLDQAEARFHKAVSLRPNYAKAHLQLANLYRSRDDPRAAEHAEKAASSSGRFPSVSAGAPSP
ncbi:MAG: sulfatase-like hydrolase/transferase [Myxococcota bacterium]